MKAATPSQTNGFKKDGRLNLVAIPGTSFNPIGFMELPLLLVMGYVYRDTFRWALLGPMFVLYLWKECVPMSTCLHRYFSHKGFKCGRGTQFGLYILGCLASQGPPLWWASKHRKHHAHCDTKADPHSPVVHGKMYAWLGWAYLTTGDGPLGTGHDEEYMQDHLKFPELAIGENLYWVPIFGLHAAFYAYGGMGWAIYVSMLSGCLCQVLTLYFNVLFHSAPEPTTEESKKRFANPQGACRAVDLPFDPLANTFGEAYHGWHHKHPLAYKRPGLDLPYWMFIKPAIAMGFLWGENKMAEVKVA
eukprot:CAMPEP_0197590688 /NCGR_PEP_ID=MMETSP1326-20131121/11991_1 /TAXON_ID=1155430 /ORGANISM="Genus nov. species nov., Strain RCC2288" /LENGTH=302 /DNA_ID=CAMNT_0043155901 /DNA_START=123 /DNA_END=1031 /DNA_ORIENTATION=+